MIFLGCAVIVLCVAIQVVGGLQTTKRIERAQTVAIARSRHNWSDCFESLAAVMSHRGKNWGSICVPAEAFWDDLAPILLNATSQPDQAKPSRRQT
jgi:hypothetical protein